MNERGRVPFALVGVLLLVGSATLAASMGGHDPVTEPRTEAAIEDARASTLAALRSAVHTAARNSARQPVVDPANTTVGGVLDGSTPFRSYLRMRIHRRFRDALGTIQGDARVGVNVSLPAVHDVTGLRRAIDRILIDGVDRNGTAIRVTVRNVSLTAVHDGRVVERVELSPTVTVATPVLLLHDRTTRFDDRLDRPPTTRGLARGVTARLYALAWGRGYAQYAGGPVVNVVANRHVAVAVNHALVAEQRAAFGRVDPAARRSVAVLGARTLGTDLLTGRGLPPEVARLVSEEVDAGIPNSTLSPVERFDRAAAPSPERPMRVAVNRTAATAFGRFVDGGLADVLDRTYTARVRFVTDRTVVDASESVEPPPGPDWVLVDRRTSTRTTTSSRTLPSPAPPPAFHVLSSFGRRVVRRSVTRRVWRRGNRTRVTRAVRRRVTDVAVAVSGRHAPSDRVPSVAVDGVHRRGGGPLDGPNLAGVPDIAADRLIADRGGRAVVATRAANGSLSNSAVRIEGTQPSRLRAWVYRDLRGFRRELANVSVRVDRGAVGTYAANPASRLATELRERRTSLVGVPQRYDGVAGKARVVARAAYLDAIVTRLEQRAEDRRSVGRRIADRLAGIGTSLRRVRSAMHARRRAVHPSRHRVTGVGGSVRLDVDGAPPILTFTALDRERLDIDGDGSYRGLVARNVNLFTAPHGDVADGVVGALFGEHRTRLSVAAETLRAARRLPSAATSDRVGTRRAALRRSLADALSKRRQRLQLVLATAGVGRSPDARRSLLDDALANWPTVPGRALAMANGSAADAVTRLAIRRYPGTVPGLEDRDRLRLALRRAASDGSGVPQRATNRTAAAVRSAGGFVLREAAKAAASRVVNATAERVRERVQRRVGRSLARVPAGLPVTPVPAYWFATTNLWTVRAEGEYARFTVRAARGGPGRGLRYVRDGRSVRYDWDGDGVRERLGTASRVDLSVRTAVVVVVPPGGRGVGDTDGNADERSPGWNTART